MTQDAAGREKLDGLDEEKVRRLAREELEKWQTEVEKTAPVWYRPRTWKAETQGGAVLVAAFIIFGGFYEFLTPERAVIVDHFHHAIGTDDRVDARLARQLQTESFDDRLRTRIEDVARSGASAENPLYGLVTHAMRAVPILAFHGEATFGQPRIVTVTNRACQRFVQADQTAMDDRSAPTVESYGGLEKLCEVQVPIDVAGPLDIPFHARFFELPAVGKPHIVWLVLYIQRFDIETETTLPDQRTADNRPKGLCVLYNSASVDLRTRHNIPDGLVISKMRGIGNGFWVANLTENLTEAGFDPEVPDIVNETELLHSVLIEQVSKGQSPAGSPCADVEPVEEQVISVRAMVLVNKSADDRLP